MKNIFLDFGICNFYHFPATDEDMQSKTKNVARKKP